MADKVTQLYNALKSDGLFKQERSLNDFKAKMAYSGYRSQIYKLARDNGADVGSFSQFTNALGYKNGSPKPQSNTNVTTTPASQQAQSKPMTLKDKAAKVGAEYKQAPVGGTDYMKNWNLLHKREDQMSPLERAQANNARSRMQQAQKQAYQQDQNANPISKSKVTPSAQSFNQTMQSLSTGGAKKARAAQQRHDDAANLAEYEVSGNKFTHDDGRFGNVAADIDAMVAPSMTEADDLSWKNYQNELRKAGNDAYLRNKAWKDLQDNRIKNRQEVLANNLSAKLADIYSDKGMQQHIMQSANKLNMGIEEYVDKYVTPQIMNRAQSVLGIKNIEEVMPKSATEYVVRRLSDSILGTLSAGQDKSRDQIAREQEAMAIADNLEEMPKVKGYKGEEAYHSGMGTRFVSTAANMMMDSPILGMTGGAANLSVDLGKQVLTRGLVKTGLMKAGAKLSAQQLGFKVANMTMAQKIGSGLLEGTAKGALNLGGYSSITSALGQASTGQDTSLAALGEAGWEGFKHGATTGAMFGASGAVMAPWIQKFGINGMEATRGQKWLHGAQKLGAEAAGIGVEAGTMMVADNVTGDKEISVGQWLEDVVMVGAFKAGEPKNYGKIGQALYSLTHNTNSTFRFGKDSDGNWRQVDIRLTDAEKGELLNSTSGKNLVDAFVGIDKAGKTAPRDPMYKTAYTQFMADPSVSQSTKEKVNAAMGLFNTERKLSQRSVNDVKNKQILEYASDGTLLSRTSYKNAEQRRDILFRQKTERDNMHVWSLLGYAKLKARDVLGDNGQITPMAVAFMKEHGYDLSKEPTDAENAKIIADIKDPQSNLHRDWEKYADEHQEDLGLTDEIKTILSKDPLKRTDEEVAKIKEYRNALEAQLFPDSKPNPEQAQIQGRTVTEDNNLGTSEPNSEAVVTELRTLQQYEDEMTQLMDSNDVFTQNFKALQKQGLTNPQIYDWMIQQGGLTEEELVPFAKYMNQVARVQGMQQATAQAIEEHVSAFVQDWTFHGTMDGNKMNGEQALWVKDSTGRTLLVGSGEVAYNPTDGRPKEGVGDMLVCLDPNTRETVYVKVDETTLFQNEDAHHLEEAERQRLQMINSEPYNQAAQEQATAEAAKPQPQEGGEMKPTEDVAKMQRQAEREGGQSLILSPKDGSAAALSALPHDLSSGGKDTNNSSNDNGLKETLTFEDGSDVPVDANGEPDFMKMTPEQGVEVYKTLFPRTYEAEIDNTIKMLEADLKKVQKATPKSSGVMARAKEQAEIDKAVGLAEAQLARANEIKKTMTAKKVSETVGTAEAEPVEGANQAGSVTSEKFNNSPRLVGNKRTRTLADGNTKVRGHYEIVSAESLTPSHDAMNGYKKSEGFPVDENGRTVNDRDYEHDKAAQVNTDQIASHYNGQAIDAVPVVSDEGIVYDGNGRTMAGQKAAKDGTDAEYIGDLLDNAENFGFTREQIEKSGIEHPRLVLVTDERLPYDTQTFAKFNKNEKKTQSNTEQAVAKAKTLTADEVGAIVAEIDGNGSLEAFFNNPKAINDLIKTLVSKGVIGQNEVAELMEGTDRLSPQGKEMVKNILLGSIFKPETIRMLGIDSAIKNKAVAGIRAVMDNLKLGDYSLRDEIDQAIQLLYEARQKGDKVDTLLRTKDMFDENAADRYPSVSQMMALALEGKVADFRDLLDEYNRNASARNTGEGHLFGEAPTKEEFVKEFLDYKKWVDYDTRGNSGGEGGNDAEGVRETEPEAQGGNGAEQQADRLAEVETPTDLADRITETDDDWEEKGENGTVYKRTYLLDDKKVVQVDEPNENGEYTGSYYEYDGKKFGDLKEVADYIDGKAADEKIPLMPKTPEPTNVIEKAAEDYRKEHPLTEAEITNTDVFDDLPEDQKQYCIDAALDYLNGEDTSAIAEAYYRNIFEKGNPRNPFKEEVKPEEKNVSTNPMEALKKAAADYNDGKVNADKKPETEPKKQTRKELEAEKNAADDEFDAFMKELKKKRGSQLNSGFIDQNLIEAAPKMFSLAAKCAYTRIKLGMYDAKEVVKDLRKRFKDAFDGFDKKDVDLFYSEIMNQKWRDGDKRMSLNDWAEHYRKLSPEHQKNLVGDSKEAEDRKQREQKFINKIQLAISLNKWKSGIAGLRKVAEDCGLEGIKDTDIQELVETAVVTRARDIASSNAISDEVKFEKIKKLYENQPSLNQRDSERIAKQQYSTPAPYAFLADMYVKGNGKVINSALEPSAGNGMLTIGLPKDRVHVNDIDEARLMNLHRQGFKEVTSQDGTQPFADKDVDVVVTNPPFGSATPKDYDGYRISSLEGQMAINALESMKDDGRAAIIIGGKTEYAKNGSLNPKDKAFLGYLYSHYNVEDVINVDGSLYAKQGTSYPTRIILINGRRLDENSFPPVKDKARAETVKDYDELYKRISDDILRGSRMDSSIGDRTGEAKPEPDRQGSKDADAKGVRPDGGRGSKPEPTDVSTGVSGENALRESDDAMGGERGANRGTEGDLFGGTAGENTAGSEPSQSEERTTETNGNNGGQLSRPGGSGRNDPQPSANESANVSGGRLAVNQKKETKRELSSEKVTYTPKSGNPFTLQSVMPADQQEAVNKNLAKLGDADQFLVDELGYNDKDDLYKHLAAEQVDSVALAIHQAKQGNAFIIGDMTGIGKGRQAASLIRYAKKQGQIPVYFTKTAGLLSDVYRDLVDIGSPDLKPFVFGSSKEAAITDSEGNVKFALPTKNEVKRVLDYIEKNGKLPKEYDYVLTTYSQVGTGIYEYSEDGERKERKLAKGKSFGSAAFSGQRRRDAIEKLMDNGYLIMDESHTAGGDSGQGNYFQHIIQKAKNVTFFSATFAKRPDNMPIYALRTAMNQGELKASDLIDAVKRGGATLQEIMSQTLTQCGQMIRRERDMTGVTIDWKAIDDPEKVEEQRAQYDSIIGLFNDIINFQKTYVTDYVDKQNEELAAVQASMGIKKGTAALGIKNVPFASKTFNTVQQVLLSLKAKSAAERAVEYLKQGMKPVIALNNTNESQTDNIALGEEMDAPDLGTSLKKGLEGTLRFTQKDAKDNSESGTIKLSDLGPDAEAAYHELEKKIEQTSTGLSLSPIDVIKNELEKAGYKVGELTGRQTEFVYNENGTVTKVKRTDTDKKKLAREFNDGQIDALILNKSAATGISLHASSKFKDQRKRVMIVAQQQLDVNDEVQMRGRIDRTGQILRGAYEYVVSLIPAEQRLLMMFKAKLKSLDANTTSSQKSKFNEMEVADITNKYGDKVVREYMAEHLDLYSRMADPFGWEQAYGEDLSSIDPQNLVVTRGGKVTGEAGSDASKLLGRMALLKVAEQEKMLQEIGDLYAAEINRLDEMGENDLEITELPLKAKTIGKEVWKKGTEPDGDNAFADNTYIEKVNMAILKKPMKAQEVQKAQEGLTGGRAWDEYRDEKKAQVKKFFDEKVAEATQKNEERAVKLATKAKEKYLKDAKRGQKDSGMTDEQIEKMAGYQYENIYNEEKAKLDAVVKNLQAKAEAFDRVLDTFNTEDAYVLPADMNNPNEVNGFGNSYGRLIDIKLTDNFSPNASTVSFATLDGRRKITFPISGKVGSGDSRADVISAIDRMTRQASGLGDKHLRVLSMDTANWDKLVSNESRKDGYIITGNLMQALIDTKAQGVGGQLVKYTTEDGEVKTGILMPDRFKPNDVAVEAPISSVEEKFHKRLDQGGIESIKSSDGDVEIIQKYNHYDNDFEYQIRVPKSQKRGGKYFMDKELLSMMSGKNFETRGNSMLGEFKEKDLRSVLARLSNLGVKVKEERAGSEDEGTHFREERGVQYSKTDAKDVKNSRIIPEDVDKNVSSQIEKKFDDEISSVYGGELTPEERNEVERIANLYRNTPIHDEYSKDENGNKRNHGGLESAIKTWERLATDFENYYGIERITRAKADGQGDGLNRGASGLRSEGRIDGMGRRTGDIPEEDFREYQRYLTNLASAKRALEYHNERTRVLEEKYGVKRDEWLSQDTIEKIFKDFNSDKNLQTLFDRIKDQVKNLDVYFGEVYGSEKGLKGFYRHSYNDIRINLDSLSAFGKSKQDLASTILHEMLHPVTSDIIAMYQEGHTDKLTSSQIEAAKDAVDLFNEIKNTFKEKGWEEPYALTNAREFFTELSSPEWRAALKKIKNGDSWWKRAIKSIAKMLGFKTSTNKLDEAENVLDNLLSNFGKEQFDYASRHANELFKNVQSKKVEGKNGGTHFREDRSSEDLYNSLKDKRNNRKEYNGTVTELANRVKQGTARIVREGKEDESGRTINRRESLPAIAGRILLSENQQGNGQTGGRIREASRTQGKKVLQNNAVYGQIEEWAKENDCHFPESDIAKESLDGDVWKNGWEANVYRSKDGKSVIKVMPLDNLRDNPIAYSLDRNRYFNEIFPDTAIEVLGYGKDNNGDAAVIFKQPLVEGKTVLEYFNGNKEAANDYIDKFLEEMGYTQKVEHDEWGGMANTNGKYSIFDVNDENIIIDKDGKPHVIDAEVLPVDYKEDGKIEIKDSESTHFRAEDSVRIADDAPVVIKYVDNIAKKVGGKVKMVQSVGEITNKAAKEAIEAGKNITGWYDEKTGEVHLYMPNIHDRYTAEKTIWHEVVGHNGLRGLFGDKFDDFLNSVWFDLDKPENATLKKLVMEEMQFNPFNRDNAIEEGLARLAEEGRGEQGFWNNIKNKVTDFLHEIGYRIAPNTKDVKYLLWLSKNLQKHPNDAYWKMRAEAVKYRLDHETRPAVKEHEGMFFGDDKIRSLENMTKAEYEEATDGEIHFRTTPSAATALDRYHKSLNEHGYMFTESYMDNMLSLKKLMQAIVPTAKDITDIKSSENPYILQNTMQGAMSNAAQMFERNVMQPLDKAMASVLDAFDGKKDDEKIKDFNIYMIMKHGLERNRVFFVRDYIAGLEKADADILQKQWNAEKKDLGTKLSSGIIDLKDYYERMDEWIRNNVDATFVAGEHDYSGFHGLDKNLDKNDPYNDDDIIATVMDKEASMESVKQGSVRDFWNKVRTATQYSLDCDYKNSIATKENHDNVSDMFDWYVPLRKFDEATAEDVYGYITEKGDPSSFIGPTLMKAKGRKSLSETNILAQIGAMGNSAINRGGKNAIKQAFARFIRSNGGQGLVTETNVWIKKDGTNADGSDRWVETYPQIPDDATPDEIAKIVSDFNNDMMAKQATGDAKNLSQKGNIGFKFERAKDRSQHIVDVMIAGKKHSFIVNGNPRAAQALNGLLENWNGGNTKIAKWAVGLNGKIVRYFAQACTSFNPEFVARNMVKDYEFASLNLLAKEGARYTGIFEKYYMGLVPFNGAKSVSLSDFKNGNGIGLFAKYRNGTLDMNNKVHRYFKEFMENGGETGFVQMLSIKDWTKKYKSDIKSNRSKSAQAAKILKEGVFGTIEGLNEVAENMARFATYCASRDSGRGVVKSAYDAKEVTVNFNRHGSGSAITTFKNGEMSYAKAARKNIYGFTSCYLRHASMFFNAGIQSTNMLLKNAKSAPIATAGILASTPFALAALMPLVNQTLMAMLDDDEKGRNGVKDPYAELPDYIRRNSLCIYTGGGEFVTIPLAIETRAFYGLGDMAAGLIENPDERNFVNIARQSVGQIAQLVPVMDYMGTKDFGDNPLEASFQAFSPSSVEPLIEWKRNKDWKGQQIERRGEFYKNDPAWERANSGTNSALMWINKKVNAQTNDVAKGNDEMLGNNFLDQITNPSMLEHFGAGITKGAGTFGGKVAGVIKKTLEGEEIETKDKPFIRSFFYTPSETSSMQRTKSKFYNYSDELSKDKANLDKLKSKTSDPMKAMQNASDYVNFMDSKKAQQIVILELAQKQIKKINKMRKMQTDTEVIRMADQQVGLIMQDAVEKLDKLN